MHPHDHKATERNFIHNYLDVRFRVLKCYYGKNSQRWVPISSFWDENVILQLLSE